MGVLNFNFWKGASFGGSFFIWGFVFAPRFFLNKTGF